MSDFFSNKSVIYKLKLTLSVASQSIANNSTTLNYWFGIVGDGSSAYSLSCGSGTSPFNLTINGQRILNGYAPAFTVRGGQTVGIKGGSITIPHNADGTKSISAAFDFTCGLTGANVPGKLSGTAALTLPAIARATQPAADKKTYTMGEQMTITLAPASSSFTHTLTAYWYNNDPGGSKPVIATKTASKSVKWTVPLTLANALPNSTAGWGTIVCDTYNGSALIGSKQITFAAVIPDSVVPNVYAPAIAEATAELAAKFGAYIQGKSTLSVKNSASGVYNSTLSSVLTTIEGRSYSGANITSGAIQGSGSIEIKTTVTDSRGRKNSKTVTITVLPYEPPTITASDVVRCNSSGVESDDGTNLLASYAYSISELNKKNDKSFKIEWLNGKTWTSIFSDTTDYKKSGSAQSSAAFNVDSTYEVRFTVSDYFSSVSVTKKLGTAFTLINFGADGHSLAVGKVSSNGGRFETALASEFDQNVWAKADMTVSGDLMVGSFGSVTEKLILDLVHPVGSVIHLKSGVDPNKVIGGTWVQKSFQVVASNGTNFVLTTANNAYANGTNVQLFSVTSNSKSSAWQMALVEKTGSSSGRLEVVTWLRTA